MDRVTPRCVSGERGRLRLADNRAPDVDFPGLALGGMIKLIILVPAPRAESSCLINFRVFHSCCRPDKKGERRSDTGGVCGKGVFRARLAHLNVLLGQVLYRSIEQVEHSSSYEGVQAAM